MAPLAWRPRRQRSATSIVATTCAMDRGGGGTSSRGYATPASFGSRAPARSYGATGAGWVSVGPAPSTEPAVAAACSERSAITRESTTAFGRTDVPVSAVSVSTMAEDTGGAKASVASIPVGELIYGPAGTFTAGGPPEALLPSHQRQFRHCHPRKRQTRGKYRSMNVPDGQQGSLPPSRRADRRPLRRRHLLRSHQRGGGGGRAPQRHTSSVQRR